MKAMINPAVVLTTLAACFISCESIKVEEVSSVGKGGLRITTSINENAVGEQTKSMSADELLASSVVKIYKADFSGLIRRYKYSDAPEIIYLPADSYRVDVEAGELAKSTPVPASWDQKSYAGSKAFDIVSGQNQNVQVEARVANAVTKVTFDKTIAESFSAGYTFSIGTSETDQNACLVYDSTNSGKEGYFILGNRESELYWKFTGTAGGSPVSKSGTITEVEKGKLYTLTPKYTVHDGAAALELLVDYDTQVIQDIIIFEPVSTGMAPMVRSEIWAGHATVHADVAEEEYPDPSKIAFAFSADGSDWKQVASTRESAGAYSAVLTGLTGSTAYQCKLVIDGETVGTPITFNTDPATQLPNWDFETVSNAESNKYSSYYNPSSSVPELRTKFWDSGNKASADFNIIINDSSTDVPSGIGSTRSVRMESKNAMSIKLAAGNLFVGRFAELSGMNGKVNFGRPWTTRPTAVRFWYKYEGSTVDFAGGGVKKGDADLFCIHVAFGTWSNSRYGGDADSPIQVDTGDKSTFWDYATLAETIAYARYEKSGTIGWTQVTVPLDYRSLTAFPTHMLVSASASKYGDYFAGGSGSTLWIDNFELLYE